MWPWACRGNAWLVLCGGPTPGLFQGDWACGPQRSKCVGACCARRSQSPFACLPATGFPLCAAFVCPERPQLRWQMQLEALTATAVDGNDQREHRDLVQAAGCVFCLF